MTETEGPIRAPPPPQRCLQTGRRLMYGTFGLSQTERSGMKEGVRGPGAAGRQEEGKLLSAAGRIVNRELLLNGVYDLIVTSRMYWSINKLSAAPHKSKPISHTMNHPKLSSRPKKKRKEKSPSVLALCWQRCYINNNWQQAREAGDR